MNHFVLATLIYNSTMQGTVTFKFIGRFNVAVVKQLSGIRNIREIYKVEFWSIAPQQMEIF